MSSPAPPPAAAGVNYPGRRNGPWRTATTSASDMTVTVQYRPMGWGTQLAGQGQRHPGRHPLPALGRSAPGGSRTLAGGWVTDDHEGTVWYPGSAGVSASGVRGFQITVGGTQTLSMSV